MEYLSRFAKQLVFLVFCSSSMAHAANVVLYFDASYVDAAQEATNVRTTLVNNGDNVTNLTGTTGVFNAALAGQDMLVFPELQNGDLNAALDAPTRTNIANFVNGGGVVVVHGGTTPNDVNLINGLFGYALTTNGLTAAGSSSLTAAASAGDFDGAPATVNNLSATTLVAKAAIGAIANSTVVYEVDATNAVIFTVDIGAGKLIFMGWDWFGAPPQGVADGNWLNLYGFISTNVATPPPTSGSASILEW